MKLPPDLDLIWRGNPLPAESLIMATYKAGQDSRQAEITELLGQADWQERLTERAQDAERKNAALRAVLEHIRRCVRWEKSMNAAVVCIHEGSATMADIDAALLAGNDKP